MADRDNLLLGLDIGTTGTKCLVTDARGRVISEAYQAYATDTPQAGYAEQDAEDWWHAVVSTVRTCAADTPDRQAITAIGLSSQGGSLVPVDAAGLPLRKAIVWLDQRGRKQSQYISGCLPPDYLYLTTGWNAIAGLNAVQILWLRDHEPELFYKTGRFLSTIDFIIGRLTGDPVIDPSNAGITQLFNINDRQWDKRILDLLGISPAQLPRVVESGVIVGTLSKRAAAELGLSDQVAVVSGGHDQYCAALGAGAVNEGDIVLATGTAWVALGVTDQPAFNLQTHAAQSIHTVKGKWGSIQSLSHGGICLEWLRKNLERPQADGRRPSPEPYREIDAQVMKKMAEPSNLLFYPYFNGSPAPNADAGNRGAFLGLDLCHDRYDLARAIMEGVAYQAAWMLDSLLPGKSPDLNCLKLLGGATKSSVWPQMMANILNKPVLMPKVTHMACAGAAILAGLATRIYATPLDGYKNQIREETVVCPAPADAAACRISFERYKRLAGSLAAGYAAWDG